MEITWRSQRFIFRECDVRGMTREELQTLADEKGHMQYEPRFAWLVVPGIGYGMRID